MRAKYNEQLKVPRITKCLSNLSEEADHNLNLSTFLRKVQLAVMPIGGESDQMPDFSVEIQGSLDDKPRVIAILEALPRRYGYGGYSWRNLEELLCDAVQKFALELVWEGRSIHKIVQDEKDGRTYRLHNFTYQWLFRVFGKYIWTIPKEDRSLWNKAWASQPEKNIWDIVMPKELGGYRGYRAMLRKLARYPDLTPPFLIDKVSKQEWPTYFNFQLYVRKIEIFVAKAMTRWGWNQGDDNLEYRTEFYWNYRNITLKWAQACIREHIVKELNQLFQRLNIESKIVVKGLPTARKILEIRQQMCEGKISFDDAFDACSV